MAPTVGKGLQDRGARCPNLAERYGGYCRSRCSDGDVRCDCRQLPVGGRAALSGHVDFQPGWPDNHVAARWCLKPDVRRSVVKGGPARESGALDADASDEELAGQRQLLHVTADDDTTVSPKPYTCGGAVCPATRCYVFDCSSCHDGVPFFP